MAADIVHLHNIHPDDFNIMCLPELTAMKHTLWTLHDEFAFTGHCAGTMGCERWREGCTVCPHLARYLELPVDTSARLFALKREIYANSRLTLVAPSVWLKDRVAQSILGAHPIHVIPNGVDTDRFRPRERSEVRKELGLPLDRNLLVFCADDGDTNPFKGSEFLADVYRELGHDARFLFVNIGGCKKRPPKRNWVETGYISERERLAQYYAAADLVIYPTKADSFGLVVAEAMACGTPVISFNVGGIPEIITHMATGYLAKPGDVSDFIEGVVRFSSDAELRRAAGAMARETILERFRLEEMVRRYGELYRDVAAMRGDRSTTAAS